MATASKRAVATATKVAGNKEGKGVMATRVAGEKEVGGKGNKQ